jgi:hypothetical protein
MTSTFNDSFLKSSSGDDNPAISTERMCTLLTNADTCEGFPPSKDKKYIYWAAGEFEDIDLNEAQVSAASINPALRTGCLTISIDNGDIIMSVEVEENNDDEAQKSEASTKNPASAIGSMTLSQLLDDNDNALMSMDRILDSHVLRETENKQQHNLDQDYSENVPKRICLEQEYHDHIYDPCADLGRLRHRRGTSRPFPTILYTVLNDMKKLGTEHIASWQPHGRAFAIHDQDAFEKCIIRKYFRGHKMASFLRQLNAYGFIRMDNLGPDQGAYYHELFLRGREDLCTTITRNRTKGNIRHTSRGFKIDPDFYAMCPIWLDTEETESLPLDDNDDIMLLMDEILDSGFSNETEEMTTHF